MGAGTLSVDVMAFEAPCERCGFAFWWVFGLVPSFEHSDDEFVSTDFPDAVALARRILSQPDADTADIAAQLHDRPPSQRGRSYNPNRCPACGDQAAWSALEHVIIEAYHRGEIRVVDGRVPVSEWRPLRGRGQGIAWPR